MANKNIISVKNLSYSYQNEESGERINVLKDVSFEVKEGEFVSLVGPSGCGKSTLLKLIAGLIKSRRGSITLDTNKVAFVFQNFALFPWLSVKDNVAFGLKMKNVPAKERAKITQEKIDEVGLAGFENKYPAELSGGMRQRVGIARALAIGPDLLLMDEPFSSLDVLTAEKLRAELLGIWLKYKMTVVMVTHLVEEAIELSDRVLVFNPRPTSVKEEVEVKLSRPRAERSEDYYRLVDHVAGEIE